jgi:hypothetical protein
MVSISAECVACEKEFIIKFDKIESGKNIKTYQCISCWEYNIFEYSLILEKGNKMYKNKEWLEIKYEHESLTMIEIGEICGVSAMTIRDWLKRHSLKIRNRGYTKK